jgi:hypothetical protein
MYKIPVIVYIIIIIAITIMILFNSTWSKYNFR